MVDAVTLIALTYSADDVDLYKPEGAVLIDQRLASRGTVTLLFTDEESGLPQTLTIGAQRTVTTSVDLDEAIVSVETPVMRLDLYLGSIAAQRFWAHVLQSTRDAGEALSLHATTPNAYTGLALERERMEAAAKAEEQRESYFVLNSGGTVLTATTISAEANDKVFTSLV